MVLREIEKGNLAFESRKSEEKRRFAMERKEFEAEEKARARRVEEAERRRVEGGGKKVEAKEADYM